MGRHRSLPRFCVGPYGEPRSRIFSPLRRCTRKIVSPLYGGVVPLMARAWDSQIFDSIYAEFICQSASQFGPPGYSSRYRSRFKTLIKRFCYLAPPPPLDVLDIGGGQLALLCKKLWDDRACVADLGGPHFDYLKSQGVETVQWNLCKSEQP